MPIPAYLWHPISVHFSVALLSMATLFYLLPVLFPGATKRNHWIIVAEWALRIGAGLTALTLLFGWLAFNTVNHDDTSHQAMLVFFGCLMATGLRGGELVFRYGLAVSSFYFKRGRMPGTGPS